MNAPGTRFGLAESAASLRRERLEGKTFAALWRTEQRHKAMLDELYRAFPRPGHRTCDEWID